MNPSICFTACAAFTLLVLDGARAADPAITLSEFIYEKAPFPECHASTIAEAKNGLVAAWFGGKREGSLDVGIWVSRRNQKEWTPPIEVANGQSEDGQRYPCWNPVLFQPAKGPLLLFYKVGPSPSKWWGMLTTSDDGGQTWTPGHKLPAQMLGPIKNKPVLLPNGELLCPTSTEHQGWRVHFEKTSDLGKNWSATEAINDGKELGIIQPTILFTGNGSLLALCRSRQGKVVATRSSDDGKTWSSPVKTELPNPNSGIDAVTLANKQHLLVYNHTPKGRSPLNVAVSDDGQTWKAALILEDQPGEYSYPAVIQTADGLVHITYTWKRAKVKHVVVDPAKLVLKEMRDGQWPK